MKRFVCVLFILTLFAASVFADKKRFYENGKVIDTMYVGEEYKDDRIWELEFVFENDGSFHYHERGVDFYCYPSFSNSNNASLYSVTSKGNFITWYDVRSERWNPNDPIDEYVKARIKWGISAKGTKFERLYRDYWDPIMKEHQEKADALK